MGQLSLKLLILRSGLEFGIDLVILFQQANSGGIAVKDLLQNCIFIIEAIILWQVLNSFTLLDNQFS